MKKISWQLKIVLSLVSFLIIFSFLKTGLAKTTITVDEKNCQIKVTVFLAFYGDGATEVLINKWKEGAKRTLNAGNWKAGDCKCSFTFDVITTKLEPGKPCPAGYHCINVLRINPGTYHRSSVRLSMQWGEENSEHRLNSGTGEWDDQDTEGVASHEIGHLTGLPDEYQDVRDVAGNVTGSTCTHPAASPHTIMCKTGDPALNLSQSQIDKLVNGSGVKCPNKCCCGNNKVDSDKGEECDPPKTQKTFENKCGSYQKICADNCVWKGQPKTCCGDGIIQKPNDLGQTEQCEKDTDCKWGEMCCPETCKCLPQKQIYD